MTTVAVLGAGVMGREIICRLAEAGVGLRVFNRTPERVRTLGLGSAVRIAGTPAEAATGADAVLSVVTDDEASRAVWAGPEGALGRLGRGAVAIECSTLSPGWLSSWSDLVEAAEGLAVAAPLTGSRPAARSATLIGFVGGSADAQQAAAPVLGTFCAGLERFERPVHAGHMKMLNNLMGATALLGLSEAVVYAEDHGLDVERVVGILSNHGWGSKVAESKGGAMVAESYLDVSCAVGLLAKDLRYAVSESARRGRSLPVSSAVTQQLSSAAAVDPGVDMAAVRSLAYAPSQGPAAARGTDWFSHSVFTPEPARHAVSAEIESVLADATLLVEGIDRHHTNLFLSGSLARREPSITWRGGRFRLCSDFDLVAVTRLPEGEHDRLREVADQLMAQHRGSEVSVFVVAEGDLPGVRSMFGSDLVHALGDPIHEGFEVARPGPVVIGARERIENLVHQLGSIMAHHAAHPGGERARHVRRSGYYHRLRVLLEAVRCVGGPAAGPARFSDALHQVPAGFEPDLVAALVRDREVFVDRSEPESDTYGMVARSAGLILGAEPCSSFGEVLEVIRAAFRERRDVMNTYQLSVLTLAIFCEADPEARRLSSEILTDAWRSADRAEVLDAADALDCLAKVSPTKLEAAAPETMLDITAHLCVVRLDYYRHLGLHNFGRRPFPGYDAL